MFSYFSSFIFIRLIHWKTYAFYVSWFFSVFVLHTWNQYEIVEEAIINSSLQFCSQNILQSPVTRDSTVYHSTQGILENESSDAIIYTFHPRLQINKHWRHFANPVTAQTSSYRRTEISAWTLEQKLVTWLCVCCVNRPRYWLLKETGNFRTDGTRLPAIYRCTDAALLSGSRACLCSSWAKENTKTTAAGLTAQSPLLLSRLSPRSFTLLHATLDFFFVPFFLYTYLVLPLACFDLRFCYIHIYIFCPVGSGSLRELFFWMWFDCIIFFVSSLWVHASWFVFQSTTYFLYSV